MKLRENLSTLPFLDQPPLSAFYPLSTEIFEPPLPVNFGKLQPPPFIKGGGSELCSLINCNIPKIAVLIYM